MELSPGGIDLFYLDESELYPLYVITAVRVPFLRPENGTWKFVWSDYLNKAVEWRRGLSERHNVRFREELHANKILSHQGLYKKGRQNLRPDEAVALCKDALKTVNFLPPASIITAFADEEKQLFGERRGKAAMLALFQRIRNQCNANSVNGIMLFDDGRPEYISFYRRATKWLPTGSMYGGWDSGSTANFALDMFPKDANVKASKFSLFLQIADLVVYSARLKLMRERELLNAKRVLRGHGGIYDSLDGATINKAATNKRKDGIVPI